MVCKLGRHPLYACKRFRSLPHKQMVTILKQDGFCPNCFKPGCLLKQCPSIHRCQSAKDPTTLGFISIKKPILSGRWTRLHPCQKYTWQHHVPHITSEWPSSTVLLTTCQVWVIAFDNSTTIARALLDLASSTSFITECLAQHLHLQRQYRHVQISCIGGITVHSGSHGVVNFKVSPITHCGKVMGVWLMGHTVGQILTTMH